MRKALGLIFLVMFVGVSAFSAKEQSWNSMMTSFIEPLREIYSVDLNKKKFTEAEKETIQKGIKKIKSATHKMRISFVSFFSRKDPAVKSKYKEFLRNLDHADKSLMASPQKSIYYLKNTFVQCASCHSDGGKSTKFFSLFDGVSMPAADKGRLAMALRDFDASTSVYRSLVLDKKNHENIFVFNKYLINYLNSAILGETKKEVIVTDLKELKKKLGEKFIAKNLDEKIKDVQSFKEFESVEEAIFKYKKLEETVDQVYQQMYTVLSVKNYLHAHLKGIKDKKILAESHMILGDIYNQFVEISVFMVSERNYEICVETLPESDIAKTCLDKYVKSIVLGYSGSAGTNVPLFEKEKIERLKKLIFKN
ncbi:MAG: hypothetical protein ACRBBP_00445 [Bdellovibrionales bacterium]